MFGMGSKTIVGLDVGSSSIKAVELKKKPFFESIFESMVALERRELSQITMML